ncbi:MAG TPA: HYR domain-containing protein, partial [Candidatus Nitrosotenuis sp.]|nr:HYR domain-containing protein [Candidatus Nitrosotenuis sp.]
VEVSSLTNDAPQTFQVGETVVTWTATDEAGNKQTVSQKISVVDTTAPKFSKIAGIMAEASTVDKNQVSLGTPDVFDSIGITSLSNDAPDAFQLGQTTVTWTATDEAGNTATATQLVTIVDTTAPQLTVPQNIVVDATSLNTSVSIGKASAEDLTDKAPTITNNAPAVFPLGDTTITWTVSDQFGNISNQTQTVTVLACGKSVDSYNLINGTEEDDTLTGTPFDDLIFGLGGHDIIFGKEGNDCIFGGDGDDVIYGNEGNDEIRGESGADVIKGGDGDDKITGGIGNDIIDGENGTNTCIVTDTDNDIILNCKKQVQNN